MASAWTEINDLATVKVDMVVDQEDLVKLLYYIWWLYTSYVCKCTEEFTAADFQIKTVTTS